MTQAHESNPLYHKLVYAGFLWNLVSSIEKDTYDKYLNKFDLRILVA